MSYYGIGSRKIGKCFSGLNSPQGVILFSAIIGFLLVDALDGETLENAGNIAMTIGQIMVTAGAFCTN